MAREGLVAHATDETFESTVIRSDLPVLVDFWAPWCAPCHVVAPTIEELAREYEGRARFVKVNVDEAYSTATSLGIASIPTIVLFHRGKPIDRHVGVQPKSVLGEMLETSVGGSDGRRAES
jgi:thioredoxin 1